MRVVSNTSPLSNLAIIGRLEFLQRRYGIVRIPPAVASELGALSHTAGRQCIEAALSEGWLLVENLTGSSSSPLPFALDAGEATAIALAQQTKADLLLMDERRGREAARQLGLVVAGGARRTDIREAFRLDSKRARRNLAAPPGCRLLCGCGGRAVHFVASR